MKIHQYFAGICYVSYLVLNDLTYTRIPGFILVNDWYTGIRFAL